MITVNFGVCNADYNRLDKPFSSVRSVSAILKEGTSVVNPSFIVNTFTGFAGCNYAIVESFGRRYYINNMIALPGGRVQIDCHVDVLASFAPAIRACTGVIVKQEHDSLSTPYLDDGSYVMQCKTVTECFNFPSGFTSHDNILITAGG